MGRSIVSQRSPLSSSLFGRSGETVTEEIPIPSFRMGGLVVCHSMVA